MENSHGWILTGFQAWAALWVWMGIVLIHGLTRSILNPEPDKIRSSGPVD